MSSRRPRREPERLIQITGSVKPTKDDNAAATWLCPAPIPGRRRRDHRGEVCGTPLPCADHQIETPAAGYILHGSSYLRPVSAQPPSQG